MSDNPTNVAVLDKLCDDMHKGENAVDYWEIGACISAVVQSLKQEQAWTKTPPTQPGWYWARSITSFLGTDPGQIAAVYVLIEPNWRNNVTTPMAYLPGWEVAEVFTECFDLWSGPIQPPPLPEEM